MSFRIATPVLLFFAALGVRILSWHSVFQPSGVYANNNDAYYHLRRIRYSIEHFPKVLDFDPLINFPDGAQPIWSATFDWLIAACLRLVPGIDRADQLEAWAVWIPPIFGAATIVIVYFLARRFFTPLAAVIAGSVLASLPAHTLYSRLGDIDHHFLVAAIDAVMLWIAMALFRDSSDPDEGRLRIGLSVGLGLSIAAAVLVWPGSLLHIGVLQIAMIVRLVTAADSDSARAWAQRFAIVHLVACLAVYPMSAGHQWVLWGPLSPVVLSNFQPLYFFVASACFALVGAVWRLDRAGQTPLVRMISAIVVGASFLLVLWVAVPGLTAAINDAVSWFTKDEEFQSIVNESVPLFWGPSGRARAMVFLSGFVYVIPFMMTYLAWQFRHRAEVLLLLGWSLGLFLATLVQWRFMSSFSIAEALLIGVTFSSLHQACVARVTNSAARWAMVAVSIILVAVAFEPSAKSYDLHLRNVIRSLRGEEVVPAGSLLHTRFVADAARFLRDHSPPPEQAAYSVLGPWGDGHLLKYYAERAIVQDNFGDDVAPENFRRAEAYFSALDEATALALVAPVAARYVLVRSIGSGHSRAYSPESLFNRLYQLRGSRGQPQGLKGRYSPSVPALQRHRLIYQSEKIDANDPKPYCMLFEIVRGAELWGRAEPGTEIRVSLPVMPRIGQRFTYTTRVVVDDSGQYTTRLPYPNESFSGGVRTGDHYVLSVGQESARVFVPESAVREGSRIVAPMIGG